MALVAIANEHSYYEFKHCTAYNFEDYIILMYFMVFTVLMKILSMKISWLHMLHMYIYSKGTLAIHKKILL